MLIVLTITVVSFLILVFFFSKVWIKLDNKYNIINLVQILHALITGIFIWYIWKKMPVKKKTKINDTLMVLFLGVIGMWIWLPNKKELNKLIYCKREEIELQNKL